MKNNLKSEWYTCIKPSFTPPSYVFPIVWTALYIMIALSFAKVLQSQVSTERYYLIIGAFIVNLLLNIAWTWAYFGARNAKLALAIIALLWISIIALIIWVHPIYPTAAYLLIPYLLWVTFASLLNGASALKETSCAQLL